MTIYHVHDRSQPIGDALEAASDVGILVETNERISHALLPLTDDVIDFLLERNPILIDEGARIGRRMEHGEHYTHEEVKRLLGIE